MDSRDADRLRRLRAARATGRVDVDLIPWLCDLAGASDEGPDAPAPADRLALRIGAEIDRWMTRRGVTHRTVSCSRRSLARALKGATISTATLADIADALGCDVVVEFRPRAGSQVAPRRPQVAPASCRGLGCRAR